MSVERTDERLLLLEISRGDKVAFRQLYEQTSPLMFAIALRLLRNQSLAEEIIQEVYVSVWSIAAQYHTERGSVKTWLSTITRNRCIDQLRKTSPALHMSDDFDGLVDERADPLFGVIADSHKMQLSICIDHLKQEQRQSIFLAFFDGLTHQQIATEMAVPLGSTKTWIRRGLEALRQCMGGLAND